MQLVINALFAWLSIKGISARRYNYYHHPASYVELDGYDDPRGYRRSKRSRQEARRYEAARRHRNRSRYDGLVLNDDDEFTDEDDVLDENEDLLNEARMIQKYRKVLGKAASGYRQRNIGDQDQMIIQNGEGGVGTRLIQEDAYPHHTVPVPAYTHGAAGSIYSIGGEESTHTVPGAHDSHVFPDHHDPLYTYDPHPTPFPTEVKPISTDPGFLSSVSKLTLFIILMVICGLCLSVLIFIILACGGCCNSACPAIIHADGQIDSSDSGSSFMQFDWEAPVNLHDIYTTALTRIKDFFSDKKAQGTILMEDGSVLPIEVDEEKS